jgi:CheY-like chemotaxis protein
MPVMNGFEVIKILHKNPLWTNIPIIVSSSKDLTENEMNLLRKKVIEVFQKGKYQKAEMLNKIHEVLTERSET